MVTASLPAVVSVVEKKKDPRNPTFKGFMAAKKKPVQMLSLADIGVDAPAVGLAARRLRWLTSRRVRRAQRGRS